LADNDFYIKEHSFIARIASRKMNTKHVAIVIGNTIHLHNVSKEEFLKNERWVRHEMCHINQYKRYGVFRFIVLYLWESIRSGYHNNKFEIEARQSENII